MILKTLGLYENHFKNPLSINLEKIKGFGWLDWLITLCLCIISHILPFWLLKQERPSQAMPEPYHPLNFRFSFGATTTVCVKTVLSP